MPAGNADCMALPESPVVAQTARIVRWASGCGGSIADAPLASLPTRRECHSSVRFVAVEVTACAAWRQRSPACGATISRHGSSSAVSVSVGSAGSGSPRGKRTRPMSIGRVMASPGDTSSRRRVSVASAAGPPRIAMPA